jgi:hypothetical protein
MIVVRLLHVILWIRYPDVDERNAESGARGINEKLTLECESLLRSVPSVYRLE